MSATRQASLPVLLRHSPQAIQNTTIDDYTLGFFSFQRLKMDIDQLIDGIEEEGGEWEDESEQNAPVVAENGPIEGILQEMLKQHKIISSPMEGDLTTCLGEFTLFIALRRRIRIIIWVFNINVY